LYDFLQVRLLSFTVLLFISLFVNIWSSTLMIWYSHHLSLSLSLSLWFCRHFSKSILSWRKMIFT
jgi:hypothetical protein